MNFSRGKLYERSECQEAFFTAEMQRAKNNQIRCFEI
jgi:hypothetical protein